MFGASTLEFLKGYFSAVKGVGSSACQKTVVWYFWKKVGVLASHVSKNTAVKNSHFFPLRISVHMPSFYVSSLPPHSDDKWMIFDKVNIDAFGDAIQPSEQPWLSQIGWKDTVLIFHTHYIAHLRSLCCSKQPGSCVWRNHLEFSFQQSYQLNYVLLQAVARVTGVWRWYPTQQKTICGLIAKSWVRKSRRISCKPHINTYLSVRTKPTLFFLGQNILSHPFRTRFQ